MTIMKKLLLVFTICVLLILSFTLCSCSQKDIDNALVSYDERVNNCKTQIEQMTDFKPDIVIVLGTALGNYVNSLTVKKTIPYKDINGWPVSTAPTHAGNLVFAEYKGLKLAIMQGRLHYYEGYTPQEVVLPLRVLHALGAKTVIISNAVGSLNPDFRPGEFVCVKDQISSFAPSPLIGQDYENYGPRFVGMVNAFDQTLQNTVLQLGQTLNIPVHSGIYLQVTGPQYETPTEIKMYRSLGADTIAMSMCDEVLAARQMNMKVCGINCITNMGAGMEEVDFSEDSIEETSQEMVQNFVKLVNGLLDTLAVNN